jgi:transposase-like protein
LAGDKTLAKLARRLSASNQITESKRQLNERAAGVFSGTAVTEPPVDLKALDAQIGQLPLENDFLESAQTSVGLRAQSDD